MAGALGVTAVAAVLVASATKTVGPSPPLGPGALAQASLCVLLATLRHPALEPGGPALATAPDAAE